MAAGAVGAALLVGCGGGGGGPKGVVVGPGGIGNKNYTGTISLPSGVNPANVKVLSGLQYTGIKASGFSGSAPSDAPTILTAIDTTQSKVVSFGIFDPTLNTTVINTTSTAAALMFVALGGFTMTRDGMKPLLDAINASPQLPVFAGVVASRLKADPYAISDGDTQLADALATAVNGFPATFTDAVPGHTVSPADQNLALIQPTDPQDGATFVQLDSGTGFQVQNTKRRSGFVYTYLTAHFDSAGNRTDVSPPQQVGQILEVPSTQSLLSFGHGWSPVTSTAVTLDIDGSDAKTEYTLVFLCMCVVPGEPAFFSDPMWANEVADWRSTMGTLFENTVLSVVADVVLGAIGYAGLTYSSAELAESATQIQARATNVYGLLYDAFNAGKSATAYGIYLGAKNMLQLALRHPTDLLLMEATAPLLAKVNAQAAKVLAEGALSVGQMVAIDAAIAAFLVVGALALAADVGAIIKDTATGNKGDLWTEVIFKQNLKLTPQTYQVSPGGSVPFSVITTATLVYDWIQDSPFATLSAASGAVGNTLSKVPDKNVTLITTGSDSNPIHVTVIGYDNSSGTPKEVGQAGAVVTFLLPAILSPLNPVLTPSQTKEFFLTVTGNLPTGAKYIWSVTGSGTVDGNSTTTTSVPQVQFAAAGSVGTDLLNVQVQDSSGNLLAQTGTTITVGAQVSLSPNNTPSLKSGSKTTFTASVAGGTPTDAQYQWTLETGGVPSSIGDSLQFTTTSNSVTYWAGYNTSPDNLTVTLLDSKGNAISSASTNIDILEYGGWTMTANDGSACCGGTAPGTYTEPLTLTGYYYSDGVNIQGFDVSGSGLAAGSGELRIQLGPGNPLPPGGSYTMPPSILDGMADGNFRYISDTSDNNGTCSVSQVAQLPGGWWLGKFTITEASTSTSSTRAYTASGYANVPAYPTESDLRAGKVKRINNSLSMPNLSKLFPTGR